MNTASPNVAFESQSNVNEFVKGVILIIAFLALIIPFALKFYHYF